MASEEDYEAVVDQHVREVLGLGADEPTPRTPMAVAIERARVREQQLAERVKARQDEFRPAFEQVARLAQGAPDAQDRLEVVWRDPVSRPSER